MGTRKLIVLLIVGAVFAVSCIWSVASWLEEAGIVDIARDIREEFLTGTAIAVIASMLILLPGPGADRGHRR